MRRERIYGRNGRPDRYFVDGREVDQLDYERAEIDAPPDLAEMLALQAPPSTPAPAVWPMKSEALGVLPKHAAKENERLKKEGIAARMNKDGTAVVHSANDKAALIKNLVDTGRLPPTTADHS